MRLWGKVVSAMMLFIAAVFVAVSVLVPEARRESIAGAVLLLAAALFGVPALVRLFVSFTGDDELLATGVPAFAVIRSLQPTGWRYNRQFPIVRFNLSVETRGTCYPVEIKQAVDPALLRRLAPGVAVAVRVNRSDQRNVVIDLREPIRASTDAPGPDNAHA